MRWLFNVSFTTKDGKFKRNIEHIYEGKNFPGAKERMKSDMEETYNADKGSIFINYRAKK